MERRRPSVENNSTYQTVLEMCLAGDAGEPEDAKTFAAEFRKQLGISDAAHRILLARLKPNAVWKVGTSRGTDVSTGVGPRGPPGRVARRAEEKIL